MLNKLEIKGSSSSGCAYILYFDTITIQLDAGIENPAPGMIKKLFISHRNEHRDHYKYERQFKSEQIVDSVNHPIGILNDNTQTYTAFDVPHIVPNQGFIINIEGEKVVYITDCGDYTKIDLDLSDATYLMLECNWDYFAVNHKLLEIQPWAAYAFSSVGHLSNLGCINAIAKWKIPKTCKIIFLHKSAAHANGDSTYKLFDVLTNPMKIAKKNMIIYCKSGKEV